MIKKSISQRIELFSLEESDTIIEDCYSSSGANGLSGVSTSYCRATSVVKRPKSLTVKGMTSNLRERLSSKVEELIVCQSQQVIKSKENIELSDISDFDLND